MHVSGFEDGGVDFITSCPGNTREKLADGQRAARLLICASAAVVAAVVAMAAASAKLRPPGMKAAPVVDDGELKAARSESC